VSDDVRTLVNLVRHGEVDNPTKVLYGRLPGFKLSAIGEEMALKATAALAGRDVRAVISSPLERAIQTATPIAAQFGLDVQTDERLIESDNVFEGKTFGVGDGALRHPANWAHIRNPFRPSWGEPYVEIAARVLAACAAARAQAAGGEAVLVSHQLPIWVTRRAVEGRRLWHRPDRRECALASITSFVYTGEHITDVLYQEPAGALGRSRVGGA
jgi:broad specificity phosphatase PhoE